MARNSTSTQDKYARFVQMVSVVGFVVMVAIDQFTEKSDIEAWLYGGMLGLAVGAKPGDIARLIGGRK